MRRIYLIDCPGVVPVSAKDSDTDTVLKGVVRVENLATPAEHIPAMLERVRPEYVERTYGLDHREDGWKGEQGAAALLSAIAKKTGKLLKGGEADLEAAAKMVLNDWIRGKIPFFVSPPDRSLMEAQEDSTVGGKADPTVNLKEARLAAKVNQIESREQRPSDVLVESTVKGVIQTLGGIITFSKFLSEDRRYIGVDAPQGL